MSWSWRWGCRDLAIVNRHYLQVLVERTGLIMDAQDELKTAVAGAVAAMEKAAAAIQALPKSGELDAANAAMSDAASQLTAASAALNADLPGTLPA